MTLSAVVLAAGRGTRMKSDVAKVLHRAAGRTLLDWVLASIDTLDLDDVAVVVGAQAEEVEATLPAWAKAILQAEQLGTAHAARVGLGGVSNDGDVLVVPGDMPLLSPETLGGLLEHHRSTNAAASVLTVHAADPSGYGRIVRSEGAVVSVVEHRDASPAELEIDEVNTSVYVFDTKLLAESLEEIGIHNDQSEYYLTDVIGVLADAGRGIEAVSAPVEEGSGVNTHEDLANVAAVFRSRINKALMAEGVWMLDPSRVYIDHGVDVAPGARLYPDTILEGATTVGAGAEVGPSVHLRDTVVGAAAAVRYAVTQSAIIGPNAVVGPYTYLRPDAELSDGAKAGAFVEVKNSVVGPRSKIPHLSYIGDTTIGEDSNIGAATVTVNYDGFEKHRTIIGDRVRIGSDTMLIAPVEIGDDAYTGAGSVITNDVAPGALGIERSPQQEIQGYAERRRRQAGADEG